MRREGCKKQRTEGLSDVERWTDISDYENSVRRKHE